MAVAVSATGLAVALVNRTMHLTAVLATIRRHLVRIGKWLRREQVVSIRQIIVHVLIKNGVVNSRCDSTRAECVFDESMAGHSSV